MFHFLSSQISKEQSPWGDYDGVTTCPWITVATQTNFNLQPPATLPLGELKPCMIGYLELSYTSGGDIMVHVPQQAVFDH